METEKLYLKNGINEMLEAIDDFQTLHFVYSYLCQKHDILAD